MIRVGRGGWRWEEQESGLAVLWEGGRGRGQPGRGSALTTGPGVAGVGETTEQAAAGGAKPGRYGQCPVSTRPVPSRPWALWAPRIKVRH